MIKRRPYASILAILGFILAISILPQWALGQSAPVQRSRIPTGPPRPLSMAHLYRTFLNYQNHLDTKAAELKSQGKNGDLMRNYLQGRLKYSDADFAPIRTSSARLTSKVKALDSQAKAIIENGPSPSGQTQLQTLTVQREAAITAEVTFLKQSLSPAKIAALEAFLTQFFSPANAVQRPTIPVGQPAPAAVQR
jgi:hypothetical protein